MIKNLSSYWKSRIDDYLYVNKKGEKQNNISIANFQNDGVKIDFEDNSYAIFLYSFYLEGNGEVAVFTEHNGYHVFNKMSIKEITMR